MTIWRALLQTPELAFVGLPAVNRQRSDAAFEERELVKFLGYLHGQFARRAKDQNLGRLSSSDRFFQSPESRNAAVLPEPVCDWPTTSRPLIKTGMASAWIGAAFQSRVFRWP